MRVRAEQLCPALPKPPLTAASAARAISASAKMMFGLFPPSSRETRLTESAAALTSFAPVFFGEAVAGARLPHLTYLAGFDNMAAREKAWDTFRTNPDWARVRNKPGWTDPEAVSNIHAAFLRPTAYSQIR